MSHISGINIKHLKLTAIFLLSPLLFFAQSLTGLWTGALSNDSNTIRKDQSFEIALTEYRGKVYGYSLSEFIVNDTLYYILKRVKGTIDSNICEVTDDEIISYNFRGKLDKGIKVTSTFRRNKNDSTWYLDGTWKTNATKKYYAVTGKVGLQEEKDLAASKLFPHLEELSLANDIAFYREKKEEPVIVKIAHPEKIKTEYNDRPQPIINNTDISIIPSKPNLQKVEAEPQVEYHADKNPVADIPITEIKNIPPTTVAVIPEPVSKSMAENKIPEKVIIVGQSIKDTNAIVKAESSEELLKEKKPVDDLPKTGTKNIFPSSVSATPVTKSIIETKKPGPVLVPGKSTSSIATTPVAEKKETKPTPIAKVEAKKEQPVVKTQPMPTKESGVIEKRDDLRSVVISNPVTEKKETDKTPTTQEIKKPLADVMAKAAVIEGRKSEFSRVLNFKADSLELSIYDNGEIDGDTVSVFMNGEVFMSKIGLTASAIKKTIYITPGNEDFTLVLFAENLGKYPPNTGLLVVHDGDDVYNLRFSSDFQKNAGIVFKRKK